MYTHVGKTLIHIKENNLKKKKAAEEMPGLLLSLFHEGEEIERICWSDFCAFMQREQASHSKKACHVRVERPGIYPTASYLVDPRAESVR